MPEILMPSEAIEPFLTIIKVWFALVFILPVAIIGLIVSKHED